MIDLISDYSWIDEASDARPTVPTPWHRSAGDTAELTAYASAVAAPVPTWRTLRRRFNRAARMCERMVERAAKHDASTVGMQFLVLVAAHVAATRIGL